MTGGGRGNAAGCFLVTDIVFNCIEFVVFEGITDTVDPFIVEAETRIYDIKIK